MGFSLDDVRHRRVGCAVGHFVVIYKFVAENKDAVVL